MTQTQELIYEIVLKNGSAGTTYRDLRCEFIVTDDPLDAFHNGKFPDKDAWQVTRAELEYAIRQLKEHGLIYSNYYNGKDHTIIGNSIGRLLARDPRDIVRKRLENEV